jgi:hypothetical protein
MLEGGFNIARDLQDDKRGALKHLLRMAILMDDVKDDFYMTRVTEQALLVLFASLAPVGRLLGYKAGHPEYGGQDNARGRRSTPAKVVGGVAVAAVICIVALFVLRRATASRTG